MLLKIEGSAGLGQLEERNHHRLCLSCVKR